MKKLSDYIGQKVAVNCTTPEQAEAFCKLMNENGFNWFNGKSYLEKNHWNNHKENTCYDFNKGEFGDIEFYQFAGYTILPATDFLEEEFIYGQEYEFSGYPLFDKRVVKGKFMAKTTKGDFIAELNEEHSYIEPFKYCRKINTERNEAITTAKELITKFDIKQEELFNK